MIININYNNIITKKLTIFWPCLCRSKPEN